MDRSIGDLFREHGEQYIKTYKPPLHVIKLIRAIRICKTPALGGKKITCRDCGKSKLVYFSCGHSQCPLCQYNKRQAWKEKLDDKLLKVPYCHTVFTIDHRLNPICKAYPKIMYNIIMRASWQCIKTLTAKEENLGALPGMVAVLHTFGSDMKFHLHVHALITFGGIDNNGNWVWPKRKKQLAGYRDICKNFREIFLKMLCKEIRNANIIPTIDIGELLEEVSQKRWNVRNGYPTANLDVIQNYLARYINRVAVSKSRFEYLKEQQKIKLTFNDYRNQKKEKRLPKLSSLWNLSPPCIKCYYMCFLLIFRNLDIMDYMLRLL